MTTLASLSSILGERETGQDVRSANVMAVQAVANILKSSLGPQGLDKMLVNDVGDVTITNDGATILKQLEVQHPAARVLVDLSDLQDQEVGDGTTSVVLIAAELLKRANILVKNGIHPTSIIAGYKLAMKESITYIKNNLVTKADAFGRDLLVNVAKTTLSSKYIGAEADHFAGLIVDAIMGVKSVNERGDIKYPVQAINVLKTHGRSAKESMLCDGYALARISRSAQGMPQRISKAQIALLDFNLRQHRMQLGVQIQITDPKELERVRQKERDITKCKIEKILKSGANVVLSTQGIDDMALKYFVEANAIAVRRIDRKDMRRIARATGATMCLTMATLDGDEEFQSSWLGECNEVVEDKVGDWDFLFFKGCKSSRAMTLILRGANESFLDEIERSVHDALSAVSRTLEHNSVCAGGGAVEAALSVYLDDFARTLGSREQLAIAAFAEALLVIPKTLALNAAQDSLDLLARLRRHHHRYQQANFQLQETKPSEESLDAKWYGLDLVDGKIRNNLNAGVLEPSLTKIKAIRFATEAAVTILRIDDCIRIAPDQPEE